MKSVRVVLVRTHYPGNIGSVARVMANFGLSDLVLVDPIANPLAHEARSLAACGGHVLDALRILSFEDALADCHFVLASAGVVEGTLRKTLVGSPADWLPKFGDHLADGPCALVFGPEPHGLTTAEIGRCQGLITLPADPATPSFNLAMAVGITLSLLHSQMNPDTPRLRRRPAPFADLDRALGHLETAFTEAGYLFGQNAPHLMHGFRHLILKADPTPVEVRMLHGLAAQLEYIARRWRQSETRPAADE
ncbi:tRNA (cytosine(32)/uridine(32)-2'-O)-methyltransferase TrmJ [soil metagenome]